MGFKEIVKDIPQLGMEWHKETLLENTKRNFYNHSIGMTSIEGWIDDPAVTDIKQRIKADKLNNDYKQEEMIHIDKLAIEKSKAVEQLETDLAIVAQASERLRANAESFVNAGKDAWNNHYEKTEAELREKSDASSNHVQGIYYIVLIIDVS